jgi:hypothetical protein
MLLQIATTHVYRVIARNTARLAKVPASSSSAVRSKANQSLVAMRQSIPLCPALAVAPPTVSPSPTQPPILPSLEGVNL